MLFAKPTPKGTGAEFWGDYCDLTSLHATMSKLSLMDCIDKDSNPRNNKLLSIIPYEVRHAYQGDRLINDKIDNGNNTSTTYYGFRTDWITILFTISSLRYNAGMHTTDVLDQCNLALFEYSTRQALMLYDEKGARSISMFINRGIDVTSKYVYLVHQHLVNQYFSTKPGKIRFRSIPSMLISMTGKRLTDFIKEIEDQAARLGCTIHDLEYEDHDIIW